MEGGERDGGTCTLDRWRERDGGTCTLDRWREGRGMEEHVHLIDGGRGEGWRNMYIIMGEGWRNMYIR